MPSLKYMFSIKVFSLLNSVYAFSDPKADGSNPMYLM